MKHRILNISVIVAFLILIYLVITSVLIGKGHRDFNCSDFNTQKEAQAFFKNNPKDIYL